MIRTFDGVWGGRSDYAKYTLSSYNENRASGFFCKSVYTMDSFWPASSTGTAITSSTKAGEHRDSDYQHAKRPYTYYFTGVTFNYDDLAELRTKDVKSVLFTLYATLNDDDYIDIDMKKYASGNDMVRCDKDGGSISTTKLGKWSDNSPNYVSREDGVCTFDLTNDVGGSLAGVPQYGYVLGCAKSYKQPSFSVTVNGTDSPLTTSKRAMLYVVTNERQSTLTFDAEGGSGAPASVTGVGVDGIFRTTLPMTEPTKSHKQFGGWSLTSGGSAAYQPGDTINVNGDTTLYAVWEPLFVHVIYLPGEGGTGEYSTTMYGGSEINIIDVSFFVKKPGYSIAGYSDTDGGQMDYSIGDHYTLGDEDKTFYACWSTATYTISYDANGGSGAPEAQTKTGGTPITLSADKPTRAGYTFLGWSPTADGEPEYQPGDEYAEEGDATLYAVWEEFGGLVRVATHQGVKAAKAYVMTENGIVRASAYVMTDDGLKEGK